MRYSSESSIWISTEGLNSAIYYSIDYPNLVFNLYVSKSLPPKETDSINLEIGM